MGQVCSPETSVPTNLRCLAFQNVYDLIYEIVTSAYLFEEDLGSKNRQRISNSYFGTY